MSNEILSIRDMRVGDFVTVHGWIDPSISGFDAEMSRYSPTNFSYVGAVLRIKHIDDPFVVVEQHMTHSVSEPVMLDIRRCDFAPLDYLMVKIMIGKMPSDLYES